VSNTETKKRIYRIHDKLTGDVAFIRSPTMAQAINWHTRDRFRVSVATADDTLGVPRESIQDSTVAGVHPDQQPLPLTS
jgi:hypothetical protein